MNYEKMEKFKTEKNIMGYNPLRKNDNNDNINNMVVFSSFNPGARHSTKEMLTGSVKPNANASSGPKIGIPKTIVTEKNVMPFNEYKDLLIKRRTEEKDAMGFLERDCNKKPYELNKDELFNRPVETENNIVRGGSSIGQYSDLNNPNKRLSTKSVKKPQFQSYKTHLANIKQNMHDIILENKLISSSAVRKIDDINDYTNNRKHNIEDEVLQINPRMQDNPIAKYKHLILKDQRAQDLQDRYYKENPAAFAEDLAQLQNYQDFREAQELAEREKYKNKDNELRESDNFSPRLDDQDFNNLICNDENKLEHSKITPDDILQKMTPDGELEIDLNRNKELYEKGLKKDELKNNSKLNNYGLKVNISKNYQEQNPYPIMRGSKIDAGQKNQNVPAKEFSSKEKRVSRMVENEKISPIRKGTAEKSEDEVNLSNNPNILSPPSIGINSPKKSYHLKTENSPEMHNAKKILGFVDNQTITRRRLEEEKLDREIEELERQITRDKNYENLRRQTLLNKQAQIESMTNYAKKSSPEATGRQSFTKQRGSVTNKRGSIPKDPIDEKYEQFDVQQMVYYYNKEYHHLKLTNQSDFMARMLFDVFKRQSKDKRIENMVKEKKKKIDETKRVKTFNRLIEDANRRLEKKNHQEKYDEDVDEMNRYIKSHKKYNPDEWNEIYKR